jgi:protein SMG6
MTTLHPFSTSRESILPICSSIAQSRRSQPDATVTELFVLLHGNLFTDIQLDDFALTLSRFLEHLEIEGAEEREWIMMAVTNIGAIMEYG